MKLTFSMNKTLCVLVLFISIASMAKAQNTYYYKLVRKVENGTSSTSVSGGQYITFIADICYESNRKGIGVGHGNMTRNKSYSTSEYTTYFGSSYWGDNAASFKFNADKSVLNVVIDKNNYYIYKRVTAPAGQETCSLIREKPSSSSNNNGSFAGGFMPQPVYPVQPYNPTPTPTSNSNTGTSQQTPRQEWHEVTETCYDCRGTGNCKTCYGKHWYTTQFGQRAECPNCRPDGKCTTCGGSRKITKRKYY